MRKRILAAFFTIIMLVTIAMPLAALANAQYRYVYTSNGKSLNLRSAPIAHANNKITGIPYGAKVTVDSYVNNRTWAFVEYNDQRGYVMTRFLVKTQPNAKKPTPTPAPATDKNYTSFVPVSYTATIRSSTPGGFVNLRWAPSKSEAIEARLFDGQAIEIIAENKSWAQVRVTATGTVGFVMRAFISNTVNEDS